MSEFHGNLKILNQGDYLCPKCNKHGRKQELRNICRGCFREEKRILQNRWNHARAEQRLEEKLEQKRNAWDTTLATRFTTISLRIGA